MIVDDGSLDGTVEIARSHMNNWGPNRNCMRVIKLPYNGGKGRAVREGVLNSKGNFILMVSLKNLSDRLL